jgi:cell division protein FtsW
MIFAYIVIRSLIRVLNEEDKFVQIASIGIISQFGLQSIINIGVTLNLLPTKGMTLPFISYGGCSTFAVAIAVGILLGFTKEKPHITKYVLKGVDL